ncbi:hypothetical protein TVAG_177150 [Trichomonas vaginalis G3]|uniref:Uncharacterized protein n=1 Tax=Trichomonas vaginalis (strain ATCC PRA-98 / G3) TaxID=412133 RepID=A2F9U7_TRIV3|nr:hypothetical protein TVAGG3_1058190 [Trichomonas vaginalis G3]EAX98345.1 hypothetical protein TVAG_177150 [Trichomonas vaginalis G3]KAI5494560.1 hypothetical protein TVAGG3_1058190 [Trichomonas vaginalis G3]|eukprot:XP_001311275.1 hypothetical protein [Trichomonas vaginalis G3]
MNFEQVILRLLLQFPSHTFLQNKIREFIEEALENTLLRFDFASFLIPPLMEIATASPPSALHANAYEILSFINENSNKHGNLKEIILPSDFISFIELSIKPRAKMLKSFFY